MIQIQPGPFRPPELEEGNQYFLRTRPEACRPETWEAVRFIGYTPCPAVVIVATEPGIRMPIARDDLFPAGRRLPVPPEPGADAREEKDRGPG